MSKLRVFQNVYQKRTVQEFLRKHSCTVLLLLFFLPCIISLLLGSKPSREESPDIRPEEQLVSGNVVVRNQTELGKEDIPLEMYVADKLARTMDQSYEKEALKAQAVLLRTNLLGDGENIIITEDSLYGKTVVSDVHWQAVSETKGMVLEYENKPIYGAFFKAGSGYTRNVDESGLKGQYPYLTGVPCGRDFMAENYYSAITYTREGFEELWKQIPKLPYEETMGEGTKENDFIYIRDSAGYVVYFSYKGEWVAGEEFRYALAISSSDFWIKEEGKDLIFEVTGEGHGFGMSQFTANEMAKEGEDFLNILEYFFEGTSLVKVKG